MIEATCHCGNIAITTNKLPESITSCNCSMCYRIGALWAYYTANQVIIKQESNNAVYLWGNKLRSYHSCSFCGCITHYTQTRDDGTNRVAINTRMVNPDILKAVNTRYFDGANTFKYVEQ
ncbi:aldehyde-activating protein [Thalassotalea sp. 1_MG-2023]|uniref:GFA family protein n=1 Tax=Thalassotalea sp. 1_MG-2023 TaxID=3062680 RepID=UPI0026E216D2|nr:aldehyde-activating protein [Thalassotalea sp. 1_MG-2023]MDO6427949.1 aldehyde-activating protein [Thalassotalea sp. 1_MG-2023]